MLRAIMALNRFPGLPGRCIIDRTGHVSDFVIKPMIVVLPWLRGRFVFRLACWFASESIQESIGHTNSKAVHELQRSRHFAHVNLAEQK